MEEKNDAISSLRLEGVLSELSHHKITLNDDQIISTNSSIHSSYEATLQLLKEQPKLDAIICANNTIDLGCMNALKDAKKRIPEDISVITFDDYPYAVITNPPTTAINIDVFHLGEQAARLLIEKIKNPEYRFQTYMTMPLVVSRAST